VKAFFALANCNIVSDCKIVTLKQVGNVPGNTLGKFKRLLAVLNAVPRADFHPSLRLELVKVIAFAFLRSS